MEPVPFLHTSRAMWYRTSLLASFVVLTSVLPILAQSNNPPAVDLPILDRDNFADGFRPPSMAQSVAVTAGFYEVAHDALQDRLRDRSRFGKLVIALFDVATTVVAPLPLTDVWLHEEFHRAVMSNRGIGSANDVYRFAVSEESISVSHVRDEDLVRLKRDHPADLVRLHGAGIEGEYALVQRLQRNTFFRRTGGYHLPMYWIAKASTAGYVGSGTSDEAITNTHAWEVEEGTSIEKRDFAGHDFTAWIYDMSRPEELYTARGTHPSGVGIRRYITPDMLTDEERRFLDRQGKLQYINFLDPHLLGFNEWKTGSTRWSATGGHLLTPFGYAIDLNVLLNRGDRNVAVVLHRFSNRERSFPGIDVELVEHRVHFAQRDFLVSPRVALWQQPDELRFRTEDGKLGGLVGLRVDSRVSPRVSAFGEGSVKSEGWAMGNVHLDSNFEFRVGVKVISGL